MIYILTGIRNPPNWGGGGVCVFRSKPPPSRKPLGGGKTPRTGTEGAEKFLQCLKLFFISSHYIGGVFSYVLSINPPRRKPLGGGKTPQLFFASNTLIYHIFVIK